MLCLEVVTKFWQSFFRVAE